jgi:hypothetical protein
LILLPAQSEAVVSHAIKSGITQIKKRQNNKCLLSGAAKRRLARDNVFSLAEFSRIKRDESTAGHVFCLQTHARTQRRFPWSSFDF